MELLVSQRRIWKSKSQVFRKALKHHPRGHQHLLASSAVKHVRNLSVCSSAFSFSAQTRLCRCVWSSLHLEVTRSLLSGLWFPLYRLKTVHTDTYRPDVWETRQKRLQDISQSEVRESHFQCWSLLWLKLVIFFMNCSPNSTLFFTLFNIYHNFMFDLSCKNQKCKFIQFLNCR